MVSCFGSLARIQIARNQQHDHSTSGRNSIGFQGPIPPRQCCCQGPKSDLPVRKPSSNQVDQSQHSQADRKLGYSCQENDLRRLTCKRGQRKKDQIEERSVVIESISIRKLTAEPAVNHMQVLRLIGIGF